MPEPSAEQRRLHAFAGTWVGDDTMHPAPWDPQGGRATTTYTGRVALGGLAVVGDDVQERPGFTYLAHKVFGYDPGTGEYTFHLFDSAGQRPDAPARGAWDGDTVTFTQATPAGHVRYRYTFRGPDRYTFQMALSQDGRDWRPAIDGEYRRTAEAP
jgi:hypothetical protein